MEPLDGGMFNPVSAHAGEGTRGGAHLSCLDRLEREERVEREVEGVEKRTRRQPRPWKSMARRRLRSTPAQYCRRRTDGGWRGREKRKMARVRVRAGVGPPFIPPIYALGRWICWTVTMEGGGRALAAGPECRPRPRLGPAELRAKRSRVVA